MSRRELARTLLSGVAAGLLPAALSPLHPVYQHLLDGSLLDSTDAALASRSARPVFLSASQLASLDKLSDAIVPGSGKALSAQFIDLLLSVDSAEHQQAFVGSLNVLNAAAQTRYRKDAASLSKTELSGLLQSVSVADSDERRAFENLKGWTVGAYYSSEIGMRELGWTRNRVFPTFPVCHPGQSLG